MANYVVGNSKQIGIPIKCNNRNLFCRVSYLAIVLAASSNQALAQDEDVTFDEGVIVLETITITARRVGENLQDIPVSAVAVSPDPTANGTIDAVTEAAKRTPNLALTDAGPGRRVGVIRGIGLMGLPISPFDGTVSFALNGQPLSGDAGFSQSLDIDRVEVLRGPQNILFGRSSQGGTINIVPRAADGERDFRLSGEFGTDGQYFTDLIMGGAITDDAAGRLAVRFTGADGYVTNVGTGNELGRNRLLGAARGSLTFDLSDRTTLMVGGYFERDKMNSATYMLPDGPYENWLDQDPDATRQLGIGSIELKHQFNAFDLTAALGFQDIRLDQSTPTIEANLYSRIFGLPPEYFTGMSATDFVEGSTDERAWSGEVRLTSPEGSDWRWVTGANFYTSDVDRHSLQRSSLIPTGNGLNDGNIDLTTISAFAEIGIPITDRATLTPGIRVGHDKVGYSNYFSSQGVPGLLPEFSESNSWSETWIAGGVGVDYRITDDLLVFGSVKRGHSSGGFPSINDDAWMGVPLEPYGSSTSWTYEIGGKATVFDGQVDVSASAFFNDVRDGHLQAFDLTLFRTRVVPMDYETYGFEIDARARLDHGWSLHGGFGYTHAALKNVPLGSPSGAQNGGPVPGVPEWTATLGIENQLELADFGLSGQLISAVDLQYVGSRSADIQNSFDLKPYTLVNAKVGWQGDNFSIYAFGRNLLDERPELTGTDLSGAQAVTIGRGRTVGLGASVKF